MELVRRKRAPSACPEWVLGVGARSASRVSSQSASPESAPDTGHGPRIAGLNRSGVRPARILGMQADVRLNRARFGRRPPDFGRRRLKFGRPMATSVERPLSNGRIWDTLLWNQCSSAPISPDVGSMFANLGEVQQDRKLQSSSRIRPSSTCRAQVGSFRQFLCVFDSNLSTCESVWPNDTGFDHVSSIAASFMTQCVDLASPYS